MNNKTLEEVNEIYELEIVKIVKNIQKEKAGKVLLQFPEGMKPYSQQISFHIEDRANCQCFIWLDSCFGGCDVPLEVEKLGIDLVVQFGHSSWNFKDRKIKVL